MFRKMTIVSRIAGALLLGLASVGWSQDKPQVVGFSIAQKDSANEYGQSFVPGTQAGVQIYLRVALPKNMILKVDGEKTSFKVTDSEDQELAANENSDISFFASIADDRHSVILPVQCEGFPSSGATSLTVSGKATLNCGADAKTETIKLSIEEGGELKLGPVTATVAQIDDGFEPGSKRINLESKDSFDQIESLVFLDAQGKEMESAPAGSGSMGFGGEMTYSKGFEIKGDPTDIAQAKISYFQKIDAVSVPVEIQFGLDLSNDTP